MDGAAGAGKTNDALSYALGALAAAAGLYGLYVYMKPAAPTTAGAAPKADTVVNGYDIQKLVAQADAQGAPVGKVVAAATGQKYGVYIDPKTGKKMLGLHLGT